VKDWLPDDALVDLELRGKLQSSHPDRLARLRPMTQWISKHDWLFSGKSVLDLGSNSGHFPVTYARNRAVLVMAVEGRKEFERFWRTWSPTLFPDESGRILWQRADVRKFSPPARHFDVVSCLGLIYHVPAGLRHLERIVKQSGASTLLLDTQTFPGATGTHMELSLKATMTCMGFAARVPSPTVASVEQWFADCGWRSELLMRDWCGHSRAFWKVDL
jgi:SAM-dependent methyltransferase